MYAAEACRKSYGRIQRLQEAAQSQWFGKAARLLLSVAWRNCRRYYIVKVPNLFTGRP